MKHGIIVIAEMGREENIYPSRLNKTLTSFLNKLFRFHTCVQADVIRFSFLLTSGLLAYIFSQVSTSFHFKREQFLILNANNGF